MRTSIGVDGYCFGGSAATAAVATQTIAGMDPLAREAIWYKLLRGQRLERNTLDDRNLAVVDCALWDFAGRLTGLPVHKLLGGARDKVPAYASTMCGDDIPGGLDTPEAYGEFAAACKARGYPAFKLHTWMSPHGPDLERDIAACAAVREAVGPEMRLMLDPHHDYTREEALRLGRALEKLDYYWMEEPMNEHSTSSYVWLTENLDLPICGPETAHGQMYTRAEWILRGASDISRVGVFDVGGITPGDEDRPPLRGVPHPGRDPRRRRGQPAGAGRDGDARRVLRARPAPSPRRLRRRDPLADRPHRPRRLGGIRARSRRGRALGESIDWDFIREHTVVPWGD